MRSIFLKLTVKWNKEFKVVGIPSSIDNSIQKAYFYKSDIISPLIISLHSWAGDYKQIDPVLSNHALKSGWNYIHPDFRGKNNTPQACGSELSITDINDAIQYAIDNGNVDINNIFVVGGSGGAYAALQFYATTKHQINAYMLWSPITDLVAWHDQSIVRKSKYSQHILNGTDSSDSLNIIEAKKRSPLYTVMPDTKSKLFIFSGYHDGYDGNPVPVTHSIKYFNKYASENNASESDLIPKDDAIRLSTREYLETGETIEDRKVYYSARFKDAQITIFDGGHDHLVNHTIKLMQASIKYS